MHDDAVAKDVEAMGKRLGAAIARQDVQECTQSIEEVRTWLSTSAGVVLSRLQYVFEKP
jgi:hypothetical protein